MRIEKSSVLLNNNFSGINNKNYENKSYLSREFCYDTTMFTGRKPKDLLNVANETARAGKRHIKNSLYAQLNPETQKQVENIYKNFQFVSDFFGNLKTNPIKAEKIKEGYHAFVKVPKKRGYTLSMPYPHSDGTITVSKTKNDDTLLRLVVTDSKAKETHFLLDGFDKVVSNINQKNPRFLPIKFRYMTAAELDQAGAKMYINIADSQMQSFAQYLRNIGSGQVEKTAKNINPEQISLTQAKTIVKELSPAQQRMQSITQLLDIFKKDANEFPNHIDPQISPSNKKVVMFSLKTEDGGTLKVSKRINPEYDSQLRYVTLEKTYPEGYKYCISIDMETKEFLKCDKFNGKPRVVNDFILYYSPEELKIHSVEDKFNNFISEIFRAPKDSDAPHQVTVLKSKGASKPKLRIEDIDISEIENKKLNKELDTKFKKEQEQADLDFERSSEYKDKPLKEDELEDVIEDVSKVENNIVKEVEPKTGKQTQNDKYKIENIVPEKFKFELKQKVKEEADKLAQEYFEEFINQFKKSFSEKMNNVKSKLDDLFKK